MDDIEVENPVKAMLLLESSNKLGGDSQMKAVCPNEELETSPVLNVSIKKTGFRPSVVFPALNRELQKVFDLKNKESILEEDQSKNNSNLQKELEESPKNKSSILISDMSIHEGIYKDENVGDIDNGDILLNLSSGMKESTSGDRISIKIAQEFNVPKDVNNKKRQLKIPSALERNKVANSTTKSLAKKKSKKNGLQSLKKLYSLHSHKPLVKKKPAIKSKSMKTGNGSDVSVSKNSIFKVQTKEESKGTQMNLSNQNLENERPSTTQLSNPNKNGPFKVKTVDSSAEISEPNSSNAVSSLPSHSKLLPPLFKKDKIKSKRKDASDSKKGKVALKFKDQIMSKESASELLKKEITNAFAEELSPLQRNNLTPLQACQLGLLLQKEKETKEKMQLLKKSLEDDGNLDVKGMNDIGFISENTSENEDTFPIQAEVMSDGSENEPYDKEEKGPCIQDDFELYLNSFVSSDVSNISIEYPTKNNKLPKDCSNLTTWQLHKVRLPRFTPTVIPPTWLRLTIPPEGYCCNACGDTFFIQSSLVQHKERRSIWISLECGPCDAELTFYNRCAFKEHIQEHVQKGEAVDEETVIVRPLPLQLTKLLQPIRVPVPETLRSSKIGQTLDESINKEHQFTNSDTTLHEERKILLPDCNRKSTTKKPIRCYLCDRLFQNVRELMSHMRTDQPWSDQRVECKKCLLILPSVCAAKAHILTHPPANTSNISVCPECGSRCDGPRDFVHHLNTCGHQFRRSGILCTQCGKCFFKFTEDFINHWAKEHCSKSYECVSCLSLFNSPTSHKCSSTLHIKNFRRIISCSICSLKLQASASGEKDTLIKIKSHFVDKHPTVINRVHYIYKSKFCKNAFHSKDELRAHHDREHKIENHYRMKTCSLHQEVLEFQQQYFDGQEPRNSFITLSVTLSPEEIQEAQTRDVPTVSSVVDKASFSDVPLLPQETIKVEINSSFDAQNPEMEIQSKDCIIKQEPESFQPLEPCVCYKCGYTYIDSKDYKRHKRTCKGKFAERLCQVCGTSAQGEDFARHCQDHIREGLIICIYCNASQFSSVDQLQEHFEFHVRKQFVYPVSCVFCSSTMNNITSALAHLNTEHISRQGTNEFSDHECDHCGRKFHGERGLNVHLTRCTVGTPNVTPSGTGRQCHVCKKSLTQEMFGKHLVGHLEEGLLVCSLCDALTLPSSMALLHHLEEHSTALSYPAMCPMCSVDMEDPASALVHLKADHGFGNLKCPQCEMNYNFTYQLHRHIDIVHKVCLYAKRRYICWICRAYDHVKKETLMNHFRIVHGLLAEEVDEKSVIRTRGHGTMPSSHFIPTKPLGSKEMLSSDKKNEENELPDKILVSQCKEERLEKRVEEFQHFVKFEEGATELIKETLKIKQEKIDNPEEADGTNHTKLVEKKKINDRTFSPVKISIPKDPIKEDIQKDWFTNENRLPLKENCEYVKKRKKNKYKCTKCKFKTDLKTKMERHKRKHFKTYETTTDGFVCTECGESFVVEPSLVRHLFFAHKIKKQVPLIQPNYEPTVAVKVNSTVKCIKKNKSPKKRASKTARNQAAKGEIPNIKPETKIKREHPVNDGEEEENKGNVCSVCNKEFSTSVQLYSHLRTHGMAFLKHGRKRRSLCQ